MTTSPGAEAADSGSEPARRWLFRPLGWLLPVVAVGCVLRALLLILPGGTPPLPAAGPDHPAAGMAALVQDLVPAPDAGLAMTIAPAAGPAEPEGEALSSKALLEVAAELKERRQHLKEREREIEAREVALGLVQERLAQQIRQLEQLRDELVALVERHGQEEKQRVDRLVKVYEAMKPAKAAVIFDSTDLKLLVPVVERMREAKVAAIIEAMEPKKARALTLELARRKELPAALAGSPEPAG